mmetsp:Transcript_870/g.1173  ORF Transcript_870/g.1173 Transcript_870/m.1173 type:complete len:200 (-) Transcript_870:701-1300(-)
MDTTTAWTSRMEHYLKTGNENIHLAAILLSLAIIAGISFVLVQMLKKGLRQDFIAIAKSKLQASRRRQERARLPTAEEPESRTLQRKKDVDAADVAWKKIHGEVFRQPDLSNMLACFLGAGVQIIAMFVTLLIAIVFAFSNTEWRGMIYETSVFILAFFGLLNGYVTARYMKVFGTTDLHLSAMVSSFALPMFFTAAIL